MMHNRPAADHAIAAKTALVHKFNKPSSNAAGHASASRRRRIEMHHAWSRRIVVQTGPTSSTLGAVNAP